MAEACIQWENKSSHPSFDFAACQCDSTDFSNIKASTVCTDSILRLVGICVSVLLLVGSSFVLCGTGNRRKKWMKRWKAVVIFMLKIPAAPALILGRFITHRARRIQALCDLVLDVWVTHPVYQRLTTRRRSAHPVPLIQCPILPQELCDAIIALYDKKSSLLACSLVCIAWVPTSRRHLAITVTLTSHERTARLGCLLRSPLQTISRSVHVVLFSGQDFGQHWRVLRLLRLKGVPIQGAIITRHPHQTRRLLQIYPDTHDLTFRVYPSSVDLDLSADTLRTFLLYTLHFKRLRSLAINVLLERVPVSWGSCLGADQVTDSLPITELALYGRWSRHLARWLQSRCRNLETLRIMGDGWSGSDNATVDALIRANWQTLRHLRLAVPATDAPLNLSATKLDSIHLVVDVDSVASIDCAIKTLRTLDVLQPPPREVLIQTRHTDDILLYGYASSFSEVLVDTFGMRLVHGRSRWMRYLRPENGAGEIATARAVSQRFL